MKNKMINSLFLSDKKEDIVMKMKIIQIYLFTYFQLLY